MPLNNPVLLPHAFAASALPANITNPVPDSPTGSNAASWQQGFPPITMTPKSSGGQPPQGQDMNGVLNEMSAHTVFLQQGGVYKIDSTLLTAGYNKGAMILLNDNLTVVMSVVDTNTTDPNSSMTGWIYLNQQYSPNLLFPTAGGTANALTLATISAGAAPPTGRALIITFTTPTSNTGPATIALDGGSALPLGYADGSALVGGELGGGNHFVAVYGIVVVGAGTAYGYRILNLAQSAPAPNARATFGNAFASSNASAKMLGAGSTCVFTPASFRRSGLCLVTMCGASYDTVAEGIAISPRYGTGTAPALGAAATGTAWGSSVQPWVESGASGITYSFTDIVALSPGTAYWFDLAVGNNTTGVSTFTNGIFTIVEL